MFRHLPAAIRRSGVNLAFLAFIVVFVLSILSGTFYSLERLRTEAVANKLAVAALHARVVEDHLTQSFSILELALSRLLPTPKELGTPQDIARELATTLAISPALRSISLLDERGRIFASTDPANLGVQVDDNNFLPQIAGSNELLRFGRPWSGRDFGSGSPAGAPTRRENIGLGFIPITRQLRVNNRWMTVVAAVNPDYFVNYYDARLNHDEGKIEVLRYDGSLMLETDVKLENSNQNENSAFLRNITEVEIGSSEEVLSDGKQVLTSFRASRYFPLVVVVRLERELALAEWAAERQRLLTFVLPALCALIGLAIPLFIHLRHAEQQRADAQRIKRERQAATVFQTVEDGVVITDANLQAIAVNPAFSTISGYSEAEICGQRLDFLTSDDLAPGLMAGIVESLATTGSWHGEISNRHKNGQRYVAWLSIKHVEGSAPGNYVAAFTDITARKQAEMALQASEEKLRGLYELSTMGIALTDMHGHYLEFNESFRNICGYTCEELNKLDYWALTPKEYAEKEAEQLESLKTRGYYGPYEKEYIRKDGTRIPLRLNGVLIHEQAGNSYIWSIVEDISERKQTETQLRITASVFEAAREGITITDPSGNILDVNPAFTRISGYRRDEVLGKRPNMLASGKNDRHFYESMWTTLLQNGVWTGEIVNRRKSGEIYSEHLDIVAVRDATGRVKHYVGIFSDITKLKSHEAHLKHIAHHDSLTGLPNRLLLTDRLSQSLAQAQRGGLTLAVVYLDLDGFKPINDTYGHELGDKVLVEVAHRLAEGLRAGDTVARLGGDEFVILLLGISNIEECEFAIRRLLDSIAQPITLNGLSLSLSASLGISLYPDEGSDDADTLLRYADHAMYAAKAGGRNQFVFYSATTIPDKLDLAQFEG